MILDLLDVDPLDQRGEQSMSEFFTALEAWQRQHVQAIDVFALRVHSETLLRKVRLLEDLVASVSREYERCLSPCTTSSQAAPACVVVPT